MYTTKEDIISWLKAKDIKKYVIHEDLTVDVNQNVLLSNCKLESFPIQFGVVNGDFDCSNNNLISLKGSPYKVKGAFDCANNNLVSLLNGPSFVGKNYIANNNQLEDLEYISPYIGQSIILSKNNINCLKGLPKKVNGLLNLSDNKLTTLKHCPEEVTILALVNNNLTSLEYISSIVENICHIWGNPINTLEFLPKIIDRIVIDMNLLDEKIISRINSLGNIKEKMDKINNHNYKNFMNSSDDSIIVLGYNRVNIDFKTLNYILLEAKLELEIDKKYKKQKI